MTFLLAAGPLGAAVAVAALGRRRVAVGVAATTTLTAALAGAVWAAAHDSVATYRWGPLLDLRVDAGGVAGVAAVTVPAVAIPVVLWAVAHEPAGGLGRLIGLLTAFVGAMELVIVAADLLTVLIGWELVGACSWALIGHHRDRASGSAAAHAFIATRFGDLGLVVAAGAAWAGAGSLRYAALGTVDGPWLHALTAGILVAAAAKSAQLPFAPWLFSAMAGPVPVSALLHAAAMVAAGAYLLIRLGPVLEPVGWFGPVVVGIGLATALAGGVVATLHTHVKRVLAASTSAQFGLMFVAVGAGYPAVALAHLVTHAGFKALLFLLAGSAIAAAGSEELRHMRLGRRLPVVAWLGVPGTLALAAVPPLGGAWSKEQVVAAAGHEGVGLGLLVVAAGALGALYSARFGFLTFGPGGAGAPARRPGRIELLAAAFLAVATVALGVLWLPAAREMVTSLVGGPLPPGEPWEVAASLLSVAVAIYGAWLLDRRGRLLMPAAGPSRRAAADWLALPGVARWVVVRPVLALSGALARFDTRLDGAVEAGTRRVRELSVALAGADTGIVDAAARSVAALTAATSRLAARAGEAGVDGAVRGVAGLVGGAGADIRRLHTGLAHHYLAIVAAGAGVIVIVSVAGR